MPWQDYKKNRGKHTVTGTLLVQENIHSPQLDNLRDILVYLPPGYHQEDKHYPVIYMHDGQNLFDSETSYAGEWGADETLEKLSAEGIACIAVGIPNIGADRHHELSPFPKRFESRGLGDAYLGFIIETVKPMIDEAFRTLLGREHTGILGSSMGGYISLYGFLAHPDIFGLAGVFSPAFFFGKDAIFPFAEKQVFNPGKIYMDVGTEEGSGWPWFLRKRVTKRFIQQAREMEMLLLDKGYITGKTLLYIEDEGAIHHESAWANRLPDALRFLLG